MITEKMKNWITNGGNGACAIDNNPNTVLRLQHVIKAANRVGTMLKAPRTFTLEILDDEAIVKCCGKNGSSSGVCKHNPITGNNLVKNVEALVFEMLDSFSEPEHKTEIVIPYEEAQRIRELLTKEPESEDECMGEDTIITYTAKFDNGLEVDVKLCGVQFDEDNGANRPWAEAVLFKDGCEVACSDVEEDYFGIWDLEYDGEKYSVIVMAEQKAAATLPDVFRLLCDYEPTDVQISVETENSDGEKHTITGTAAEWFADWYGECELCPANDAPIHKLVFATKWTDPIIIEEAACPGIFEDLMEAIRPTMVYHHWGDVGEDYIETSEPENSEPMYFVGKESALRYIEQNDIPFAKAVECEGICPECGQPVFPLRSDPAFVYCHHCDKEWLK